ncbi:BTB/POZ protein [Rhizophagus irregularis DAOM 181602=DAOM 197198]|nr:BTB/POZ protein [Rhizophagus irregularis DAOM 181602=DAOM 197198]
MSTHFFQKLSQNYIEILKDDEYYDITIEVASNKIRNDGNLNHIKLPNISPEIFQVILKYIYGGIFSLDEQDTINISKILTAADQLHLQELVDYLQKYLIKNKSEWIEQYFGLIHQISFQSNLLLELQQFCTDYIAEFPEKIFKSLDFTSISEKSLISLIKRDDLKIDEVKIWDYVLKWGLAQNSSIISDPATWSDNEFNMMNITLQNCLPFIRFFGLSSKDFFRNVRPYRKFLKDQLYEELLEFHLDTESQIPNNILFPRSNELCSKIININIVSLTSAWIDNTNTILSRIKDLDRALFYCDEFGPAFDTDLLVYVNDDDCLNEYNSSGCKQRSYEKKLDEINRLELGLKVKSVKFGRIAGIKILAIPRLFSQHKIEKRFDKWGIPDGINYAVKVLLGKRIIARRDGSLRQFILSFIQI